MFAQEDGWTASSAGVGFSGLHESRVTVRFTRLGYHTAFIAVFATVGGALRGFNLLLILAGLLVGLLLIQWRLCRRSLETVRIRRQPLDDVWAGSVFRVRFQVESLAAYLPAWLIVLTDSINPAASGQPAQAICGVGLLPPGARFETSYDCRIERRGRYRMGPIVVASGFPFGLMEAKRTTRADEDVMLYVYPRPLPLKPRWQGILHARTEGTAAAHHRSGPNEGDFYGLRQWQSGDSRRWIHWRTTARIGEPAVRQFEQQRRYEMCLLVDACQGAEDPEGEALERTIRLAATLIEKLVATPTNRVTLVVNGQSIQQTTVLGGRCALQPAMRLLAETEPIAPGSLAAALETGLQWMRGSRPVVVVSPQASQTERLVEAAENAFRHGVDQLDLRWFDVNGSAAEQMVYWETAYE